MRNSFYQTDITGTIAGSSCNFKTFAHGFAPDGQQTKRFASHTDPDQIHSRITAYITLNQGFSLKAVQIQMQSFSPGQVDQNLGTAERVFDQENPEIEVTAVDPVDKLALGKIDLKSRKLLREIGKNG